MLQSLCHKLFFDFLGWKEQVDVPARDKCIICVAPHTSNYDFLLGELYYTAIGRTAGFLMKKNWFFFPLGAFFRKMGGIPVNRSRHGSLTDQLAQTARERNYFVLAVTPEGTRGRVERWKRGFYFIAKKAGLPIQLYAIDYKNRRVVCTKEIVPSDDFDADWREIMNYYEAFEGAERRKGLFSIERAERYTP